MKKIKNLSIQADIKYNLEAIEKGGQWCKFLLTYSFEDSDNQKSIYIIANGIGLNKIVPSTNNCVDRSAFVDLRVIEEHEEFKLQSFIKDYVKKLSFIARSNKFGFEAIEKGICKVHYSK